MANETIPNIDINILRNFGDWFSNFMTNIIRSLSSLGLTLTTIQGKILSFIIVLASIFIIIKTLEKPIKWLLVILLTILAISIIISLINLN